ncbi:MAG: F0F1 ATP synthase subunit B [Caldilineaceae bacterium]|nr:F0F1 ATP synthase subunit B [Caldilineaceae bacterium]
MDVVLGQLGIQFPILLAQIINFLIIMGVLRLFLYEPVLKMLDQRRERIAQGIRETERSSTAAAEAERQRNAIIDEARREAQEVRAQATRDAERIAQDIRSRADQEAADIRSRAKADAEAQVEGILAEAHRDIADLAIAATEQILGRELQDRAAQERFVAEFLAQQSGSAK